MPLIESVAKKVEEYGTFGCFILWIVSFVYVSKKNILDLTDKFTIFSGALLTFIAVFYTVIIVSEFLNRLNTLNRNDIRRLSSEINRLTNEENNNIRLAHYEKNTEVCNKKINIYNELSNIKNRKINRFLFISAFLLILILIIDSKFLPEIIFNIPNYKPYALLTLLWIVLNNVLKIILLFYKVYTD